MAAFTLIEIMVVMAIMGIVMTIAIPTIYQQLHPDSMRKAVLDVLDVCSEARAQAILQGRPVDVVFTPDGFSVQAGSGPTPQAALSGATWPPPESSAPAATSANWARSSASNRKFSDKIAVEALEINFENMLDSELYAARVQFQPNGISDEFKIQLYRPDTGDRKRITLELATGLADVEDAR
jgi:prepilin-type N-terminal cleavage/methylation domain-containing protein